MCRWTLLLLFFPALASGQQPAPSAPADAHQAGPADVLELALEKHLYFVLPLALAHAPELKPEQSSYFEGMLAFHQARFEDARKLLTAALNTENSALASTEKITALEALGESARYTFHYGACAQMYQDIDSIWGARLGAAEGDIKQHRHGCVAQMQVPPQTTDFTAPFTIHGHNSEFPVSIGDKTFSAVFDTGSTESAITESTAKAWGVVPADTTVVLNGYSGGTFRAHPGVLAQLTIGTATLHNVAVFVVPDSAFYIAPFKHQMNALLGYPVLAALGRLTFTRDGSMTASPVSPARAGTEGAPLWIADTFLLAQMKTFPPTGQSFRFGGEQEPRLFVLDTGSRDSYLTDRYFMEHRDSFKGAPPDTARLAGPGGEADTPAYAADHLPLWCGKAVLFLDGPHILTAPQNSLIENYEGLIGQSVLGSLQSYTIDFRTMRFSVQP